MREVKASLMTRVIQRVMTTKTTGLDGFLKRMMLKPKKSLKKPRRLTRC